MKLKRFLLRFHPPGIILEYLKRSGEIETKSIDLLNLTPGYVSIKMNINFQKWVSLMHHPFFNITQILREYFYSNHFLSFDIEPM
jgi:hypothetical protein